MTPQAAREETWGSRVSRRREALGLTQVQLAEMCGLTQQSISHIENNQRVPRDSTKAVLAEKLGCQVADLFPWPKRKLAAPAFPAKAAS